MNEQRLIVILLGKACVGKTTAEKQLISELGYDPVSITTTRDKRSDDPEYYSFVTKEEFKDLNFDYVISVNNEYGYRISESGFQVVSFISPYLVNGFLESVQNDDVRVIVVEITANKKDLEDCLKERNMSDQTFREEASTNGKCRVDFSIDRNEIFNQIQALTENHKLGT